VFQAVGRWQGAEPLLFHPALPCPALPCPALPWIASPSQSAAPTVMKNWQPLVLGPLFACKHVRVMGAVQMLAMGACVGGDEAGKEDGHGRTCTRPQPAQQDHNTSCPGMHADKGPSCDEGASL